MPAPLAVLLMVLLLLLLLATLPISGPLLLLLIEALEARDRRCLRAAADRTSCIGCGRLLGQAALDAADVGWAAHMAELRRRYPVSFLRVARFLRARCTACGTDYDWEAQSRSFRPLPRAAKQESPDADVAGPVGS